MKTVQMTANSLTNLLASVLLMGVSAIPSAAQDFGRGSSRQSEAQRTSLGEEPVDRQPRVQEGRFILPDLIAPSIDMSEIGNQRMPEGFRTEDEELEQWLPESAQQRGEPWQWTVSQWAAANTFSHPRYFEDRMLERHGHERFPYLQPFVSGARFFATVPMLPYLMTVRDPFDYEYTLGYYRSGSRAPVMLQRPPYEKKAALVEAAAIAGAIIAIP